ncbi:TPA: hypothetical protein DIV49_01565 [Candidatus Saccharibacteria bacterium]|nr:hypothetical protein [Candidatus Saccharibacteria bacterium]
MKTDVSIDYKFVEFIPETLNERTLYISIVHCTAVHKCCCGCGREVVTPISPVGWQLIFDGKSVSLFPSIGNWSMPCRSHYFITRNKVVRAPQWTKQQIAMGRDAEAWAKESYYGNQKGSQRDRSDAYEW